MPLSHLQAGMTELRSNDVHQHAFHCETAGVGVSQDVKRYCGNDTGRPTMPPHRPELVGLAPQLAVGPRQ